MGWRGLASVLDGAFGGRTHGCAGGARLALLCCSLGRPAPPIAGVIGLSGAYDFLPLLEAGDQDLFGPPPHYPQSQPINFVRAGAPPMLLVHGSEDTTVRPKNSQNLAAALQACGVPVTLRLYPKRSHADTVAALAAVARGRAPMLADIAAFLE